MGKKIVFAILAMSGILIADQVKSQELNNVKSLIAREQYLSAFRAFEQVKEITVEGIHLLSDILIKHKSGTNKYYNRFILEDKKKEGGGERMDIDFPLEEFLWKAVATYPDSCIIYRDISEFYHQPILSEDKYMELDILSNIESSIRTKINTKCPGYLSNYIIGYCNNYLGHADYSIGVLKKSIELNKNFTPAYQELATAYMLTKDPKNALVYANKAFTLSSERKGKSDAALVLGAAYEAMNNNASAIQNYLLADSLYRKDFFICKAVVNFYVRTGDITEAMKATDKFLAPNGKSNLYEYIDVFQIYSSYKREKELAVFCEDRLITYKDRPRVLACLYFTLGKAYQKTNPALAKQYLAKAKDLKEIDFSRYPNTRNHPDAEEEIKRAFQ